jgi:hypothetical protein
MLKHEEDLIKQRIETEKAKKAFYDEATNVLIMIQNGGITPNDVPGGVMEALNGAMDRYKYE